MDKRSIAICIWKGRQEIESQLLSDRLKDLTISWLRFGYKDKIFEGDSVSDIIEEVNQSDFAYCLLIPYGNILVERWDPNSWGDDIFSLLLNELESNNNYIIASPSNSSDCSVELINIQNWETAGNPDLNSIENSINTAENSQEIKIDFPTSFTDGWINLHLNKTSTWTELKSFVLDRKLKIPESLKDESLNYINTFLESLESQTINSRNGVFLWNLETYDDVEEAPEVLGNSIDTLLCVTAGFKPNRILETHNFDDNSHIVYYDYSPNALDVRKMIVGEWNGINFPDFAKKIMQKFPHPDTFYQLWNDKTPETLDWSEMELMWSNELKKWGGEENFYTHWQKYRSITHSYVICDLWSQQDRLIELLGDSNAEAIWWSNAFFTIFGNWKYDIKTRKKVFESWMTALSNKNKNLVIYGSDYINTPISGLTVSEYFELTKDSDSNILDPTRLAKVEIRM